MKASYFAGRLRELREQAGLTQDQLAAKAELTKDGLARLERGDRLPSWESALKLAEVLGVGLDAFTVAPGAQAPRGRGRPPAQPKPPEQRKRRAKNG